MTYSWPYPSKIAVAPILLATVGLLSVKAQPVEASFQQLVQDIYDEADSAFPYQGVEKATAHLSKDYIRINLKDSQSIFLGKQTNLEGIRHEYWIKGLTNDFVTSRKTVIRSIGRISSDGTGIFRETCDSRLYGSVACSTGYDTWVRTPQSWKLRKSEVLMQTSPETLNLENSDILNIIQNIYEKRNIELIESPLGFGIDGKPMLGTNLYWTSRKTIIKKIVVKDNIAEVFTEQYNVGDIASVFFLNNFEAAHDTWENTSKGWSLLSHKVLFQRGL
jgi:hypothetical protein